MNTESLQRWSHVLFWASIVLPTLGATAAVARFYVDRQERRLTAAQSRARENDLRKSLEAVRDYSETARLNFLGTTGTAIAPLIEQSSISRALEGSVDLAKGQLQYRCDPKALTILRNVAERFPRFPFPHYALAYCLRATGDPAWRLEADKAIAILRITTTIEGHHPNHDQALQELLAVTR